MTGPTAYVTVEKLIDDRHDVAFVDGYAWDTDPQTFKAYHDAERRFTVPFEHADYLVNLYSEPGEMVDTFPMAELGYRTLTKA